MCAGGRSYGRRRAEHEKGSDVYCYRCNTLMGCIWCCEPPEELICLVCHNWAHKRGVARHGDIVANEKVQHVRTDRGYRHWDGNKYDIIGGIIRSFGKGDNNV
jgi:hypothetical protein